MASKLAGADDHEKLISLCQKTYKEQAVWFLNAFWDDFAKDEAELFWNYVQMSHEIDIQKHEEGCGLDEMQAHVFLEKFNETLTVRDLRTKLRETGAIGEKERPKLVPLTHYLLFKYSADWHVLVNASQGDNSKAIAEAQRLLDEVQTLFNEADAAAKAAKKAADDAKAAAAAAKASEEAAKADEAAAIQREADAKASEQEAKAREADAVTAQQELEAALAEVKAQEDAYNAKTEQLKKKSEEGGVVSRNKAKNELAQHLGEDPLPLRRAKITAEAAVKKAEKATAAASKARTQAAEDAVKATESRAAAEASARQAEQDRVAAEAAAEAAEARKREAEAAVEEAAAKVAEAEAYLEEVKNQPGCAHGAIWWMERELHEKKKYMPTAKGGIAR